MSVCGNVSYVLNIYFVHALQIRVTTISFETIAAIVDHYFVSWMLSLLHPQTVFEEFSIDRMFN